MTTAAVLGLGRMGSPIAAALAAAGFEVVTFDPDPDAGADLAGCRRAPTSADAVRVADHVLTVLPGTPEVDDEVTGLLAAVAPGAIWVDCTSTAPDVSRRLAADAGEHGVEAVDCALGGGPADARARRLTLFVGGDEASVQACEPVFAALTTTDRVHHVGGPGSGLLAKLLVNLLWFGQASLMGEALLLARAGGVDPARFAALLPHTAAASAFAADYLPRLAAGDIVPAFGLDRIVEELDGLERLAERASSPFDISAAVAALHRDALAALGARDGELLAITRLEQRAGRRIFEPDE